MRNYWILTRVMLKNMMSSLNPFASIYETKQKKSRAILKTLVLLLVIIGAVNWGLIGIFQFDLVASIFGGQAATISRIIYTLVGAAGLWCTTLLFRDRVMVKE